MKNKDYPLMVAYIAFLIICGTYYVISNIYNFEFSLWKKIVAAATISSYFFSISSLMKYRLKEGLTIKETLTRDKILMERIRTEEATIMPDSNQKKEILKDSENIIAECLKSIETLNEKLPKQEKAANAYDIIAYLLFFCILTFEPLYNFFEKGLDFYTLLAFIILMITQYNEDKYSAQNEETLHFAVNNMDKYIDYLEFKLQGDKNGQA